MCYGSWSQRVQSVVTGSVSGPIMKWNIIAVRAHEGGISLSGKGESRKKKGAQKRPGQGAVSRNCPQ